jgi:uncharacterized protein
MRPLHAVPLGIAAAGAAGLGYAAGYEVHAFRLRRVEIPVLARRARPLRLLHVSDIHMVPGQRRKQEWLRSLAALKPDLVINTGDNLSHVQGIPPVLEALEPLLELPGTYVFGSNDYYSPVLKNPARYLWDKGKTPHHPKQPMNPWEDLRDGFDAAGWVDLTNTRGRLKIDGREIELIGVDDPHIGRDRYEDVAGPPDVTADLTMGVLHAPYRRVLDRMVDDGLPLILAGHTHGGQLRVPFYGALVTNCDLDRKRARGMSWYGTATGAQKRGTYLHVSAGCGTSRFAPARFACPPEATLVTLTAAR